MKSRLFFHSKGRSSAPYLFTDFPQYLLTPTRHDPIQRLLTSNSSLRPRGHWVDFHQAYYNSVVMSTMASQITSVSIVYSTVCSCADQRKHQSSASPAFVWGIHRWPVNSPHKGSVTQKIFPFDDVIMIIVWGVIYASMTQDTWATTGAIMISDTIIKWLRASEVIWCRVFKSTMEQLMTGRLHSSKPLTEPLLCVVNWTIKNNFQPNINRNAAIFNKKHISKISP